MYACKRKDDAQRRSRRRRRKPSAEAAPKEEPISTALALDLLRVELGYGLLPLINDVQGHRITDQIKALRRQLAQRNGLRHARRCASSTTCSSAPTSTHPRQGSGFRPRRALPRPASWSWIPRACRSTCPARTRPSPPSACPPPGSTGSLREEATFRGYTVVDPGTVLTTHLTEVLKSHMAELLSYAETKKLLDDLPPEHKKLVEELIPSQISVTGVQRVLQTLLAERVSIRDLPAILEGIAEAVGHTKNALYITEHVRARLARQLCHANICRRAAICRSIALSPAWEQAFAESHRRPGRGTPARHGAVASCSNSSSTVRERFDEAGHKNEVPVLLTSPQIRPFVRSIIERFRAADGGDVRRTKSTPRCGCAPWARFEAGAMAQPRTPI